MKIRPNIIEVPSFRDNHYEKGKDRFQALINFVKANPYQPEIIITKSLCEKYNYSYDTIMVSLRKILKLGIGREKIFNPNTKRYNYVYYPTNTLK